MDRIQRLSTHLANMIAAGEVVERPSSVVKELVENSIDANSNKITINLIDSGIKEILVTDNGCGMSKNDCLLAFSRHATSKIKNPQDLFRINTLGFRGEAIPSIMSVSYTRIITNDSSGGYEVIYKAGELLSHGPKAFNKGTQVLVKDLFFNTPARLKYLKSLKSELSSIVFLIGRFALSHPNISFVLTNNNKEIISTSGNNDIYRLVGELYGLEVCKNLLISEFKTNAYNFKLLLVKPTISRASRNEITIICNNRYVKSTLLSNAIIEGYSTYLTTMRYPIGCLYLDIDPLLIDVNVHPSKQIIKISNENEIFEAVKECVIKTLNDSFIEVKHDIQTVAENTCNNQSFFNEVNTFEEDNNSKDIGKPVEITYKKESLFHQESYEIEEDINNDNLKQDISDYNSLSNNLENIDDNQIKQIDSYFKENIKTKTSYDLLYMQYLGSYNLTYLLFQSDDSLVLIDQHAANERVNYERIYNEMSKEKTILIDLLIPYDIEFFKEEMLLIEDNINIYNSLGFTLEEGGINCYFVRTIPKWCNLSELEDVIRAILDQIKKNKIVDKMYFKDYLCKSLSCKGSIKANQRLDILEINNLVESLSKCQNPYSCPHGRPICVKITTNSIEKMFKRIK